LNFLDRFWKILISNFTKNPSSERRAVPCRRVDGRRDGQTRRRYYSLFEILRPCLEVYTVLHMKYPVLLLYFN